MKVNCSALEIARQAGWDDSVSDIETRVRTALAALEQSGYLVRGNNVPHVYATGITVKNMDEARECISTSLLFGNDEIEKAVRIIKSLISQKHIAKAQDSEAESRIDYLADILGLSKRDVIFVVERNTTGMESRQRPYQIPYESQLFCVGNCPASRMG